MQIGKLDISKWKYDNRSLKNPARILTTLIGIPIYFVGKVLCYIAFVLEGWNLEDANYFWKYN